MTERARRRPWVLPVTAVVAVLVVVALALFQPWKLVLDQRVDEAAPPAAPTAPPSGSAPAAGTPAGTTSFVPKAHPTTGRVRLVPTAEGTVVRFEDLDTDNGPDLVVQLVPAEATASDAALDDGALDLGALKGNVGNQNYAVPAGTDLGRYRSVVIWCRRFSVPFGAAPLPS